MIAMIRDDNRLTEIQPSLKTQVEYQFIISRESFTSSFSFSFLCLYFHFNSKQDYQMFFVTFVLLNHIKKGN